MRNNITILILVLLVGCSPKNPYYGMYGAFHPYQSFFDNSQQKTYYDIEGNNKLGQNTFKCLLPDSLGGRFATGQCVIEIKIDNKMEQLKDISLVGITVTNIQADVENGYDRYHRSFKRVHYKLYNGVEKYLPFIRSVVEGFKFSRLDSSNKKIGTAYCKLVFGNVSN